ncbi:MAG: tRNA epoxyqueuosine(34) reductase QueG [Pseudomonadota bacterium]
MRRDEIRRWAEELGFTSTGFTDIDLAGAEQRLVDWLAAGLHGSMTYFDRHGTVRSRPAALVPGTVSVISVTCDYLTEPNASLPALLDHPERAYVSRYALGRDYHKRMRRRLEQLASRLQQVIGPFGYRAFCDSAPVLEKALAEKAGLGWIGKHTNLIDKRRGSWFFLGELYTDLEITPDRPATGHCGTCVRCIDVCPTQAIVAPYVLDARRCISFLTIENRGPIPLEFRRAIGNRIFGCDDCQIFCPWNKFAEPVDDTDFKPRHGLDQADLTELFAWTAAEFETRTLGSAIRRIGYRGWLRNIAVALGNARTSKRVIDALSMRRDDPDELVREHVNWALAQHQRSTELV